MLNSHLDGAFIKPLFYLFNCTSLKKPEKKIKQVKQKKGAKVVTREFAGRIKPDRF